MCVSIFLPTVQQKQLCQKGARFFKARVPFQITLLLLIKAKGRANNMRNKKNLVVPFPYAFHGCHSIGGDNGPSEHEHVLGLLMCQKYVDFTMRKPSFISLKDTAASRVIVNVMNDTKAE